MYKMAIERALKEMQKYIDAWTAFGESHTDNKAMGMRIAKKILEYEIKKEVERNEEKG